MEYLFYSIVLAVFGAIIVFQQILNNRQVQSLVQINMELTYQLQNVVTIVTGANHRQEPDEPCRVVNPDDKE